MSPSYLTYVFPTPGFPEQNNTRSTQPSSASRHFLNSLVSSTQFPTPPSRSARTPWCRCCGSSGDSHCIIWCCSASSPIMLTVLLIALLKELIFPVICWCPSDISDSLLSEFWLLGSQRGIVCSENPTSLRTELATRTWRMKEGNLRGSGVAQVCTGATYVYIAANYRLCSKSSWRRLVHLAILLAVQPSNLERKNTPLGLNIWVKNAIHLQFKVRPSRAAYVYHMSVTYYPSNTTVNTQRF